MGKYVLSDPLFLSSVWTSWLPNVKSDYPLGWTFLQLGVWHYSGTLVSELKRTRCQVGVT